MLEASGKVQHCTGESLEHFCHFFEISGFEASNLVLGLEVNETFEVPELGAGKIFEGCEHGAFLNGLL